MLWSKVSSIQTIFEDLLGIKGLKSQDFLGVSASFDKGGDNDVHKGLPSKSYQYSLGGNDRVNT